MNLLEKAKIFVPCFIIGFLIGWVLFGNKAQASPESCYAGAVFVYQTAEVRDLGMTKEEALEKVHKAYGEDKTRDAVLDIVFSHPELSPDELAQGYYNYCRNVDNNSV